VVTNYVQGTLIIDFIDTETKELVWRVFLKQKIEDRVKAYKELKENLYAAIAHYPPTDDERKEMRKEREKLAAKYH